MSTIWRAFLPAHCLQQSQITGEVYNTSRNVNDTFYSVIHPQRSQSACFTSPLRKICLGHLCDCHTHAHTHTLEASRAQHDCGQVPGVTGRRLPPLSAVPPPRGICCGRSPVTTETPQRQSPTSRQLALLLSVTHQKIHSTLDFAMIKVKNPSSGLHQAGSGQYS